MERFEQKLELDDFVGGPNVRVLASLWGDAGIRAGLISLAVGLLLALGGRLFAARSRVVWGISHRHAFLLPPPQGQAVRVLVKTGHVWIQNAGGAVAHDVEIVLNHEPQHYEIWPIVPFTSESVQADRPLIKITQLAGREFVTLSMLEARSNNIDLPNVVNVRWRDGVAREVPMGPQRIWPKTWLRVMTGVLFLGALTLIFIVVRLLQIAFG